MSKLLSMLLEVYNEERLLPYCLRTALPFVDEAIIIDGSEVGPSTDCTKEIIDKFIKAYPGKIRYIAGTFKHTDGSWHDTEQSNAGFRQVESRFVMRTHADIIYGLNDFRAIRRAIETFPEKKVFYCPMVEFFYDTDHIRLYPDSKYEPLFPRPIVGDVPVISMELKPHFEDSGEFNVSGLQAETWSIYDALYMPHIRRFHFGFVKPFGDQVRKHVKYIKRGDRQKHGAELKAHGEKAVWEWAIKHVKSYANDPSKFSYYGEFPNFAKSLRNMSSMDGYDEFMEWYDVKSKDFAD